MSEESTVEVKEVLPEVVINILANPNDEVPPEKLLELLQIWKLKVEKEIEEQESKKQEVYTVYKRQKALYDKWLSGPMKKMKKYDKIITGRKKVLIDVNKEITKRSAELNQPNAQ